jgi:hypothetical protein
MIPVLILALSLLPLLILAPAVFGFAWWLDRQPRRDPLTTDLRRLPGNSLEIRREESLNRLMKLIAWTLGAGYIAAFMILSRRIPETDIDWHTLDTIYLLIGLAVSAILSWHIVRRMPGLRKMKQGIRAEQAAAQELAEVLAGRNRIIHDVQAQDFNIDHVVITPGGIFAVETKSRLKPAAGQGAEAVKVIYDGKCLKFPGWMETAPIEQARRQADWLARHLQAETGERLPVFPVLALPGWFVENAARITDEMVRVINPKNSGWLFVKRAAVLDDAALQRVITAVGKLAAEPAKD